MTDAPVPQLAILGAPPAFAEPILFTHCNLPDGAAMEAAIRGIFERRYFANNGPLVQELDCAFAEYLDVAHAVCVANRTLALMILGKALAPAGEAIVPALAPPYLVPALRWAGLIPVACDVSASSGQVDVETVRAAISPRTAAIVLVHMWGAAADGGEFQALADTAGLPLIFDASSGIGCIAHGRKLGGFGKAEVFSFNQDSIVNGGEGGCITTNDAALAAKLRAIRHFSPAEVQVPLRINGKMSEVQAAFALLGLRQVETSIAANQQRHAAYADALSGVPGVTLARYGINQRSNYQDIVIGLDPAATGLSIDLLCAALAAENIPCRAPLEVIAAPGHDFPNASHAAARLLQLPNSQTMTPDEAEKIGRLVGRIVAASEAVVARSRGA